MASDTLTPGQPVASASLELGERGLWSWLTVVDHKRIGQLDTARLAVRLTAPNVRWRNA